MKWMVPINSLDAVQLEAIEAIVANRGSNHLVKGFAGSGKTIVLTHVLERLAAKRNSGSLCFATLTHALKDMVKSGLSPAALRKIDIVTFDALLASGDEYDVVVADELQDLPSRHISQFVGIFNNLIAAADFDQRIYRMSASVSKINALMSEAVEHELQEVHRINDNVFEIATTILDTAEVGATPRHRDESERARLMISKSKREEFSAVYAEATRLAAKEYPSAVFFPTRDLIMEFIDTLAHANGWGAVPTPITTSRGSRYEVINDFLGRNNAQLEIFGSGAGEMALSDRRPIVYLMTYHSSKGLDFPNVFLPHLTSETELNPMKGASDEEERRLFFVAATRAKQQLYLSYHREPHRFIGEIPKELVEPFKKRKREY